MKKIQIVSDISAGSEFHGNPGATFCFKIIDGSHVQTFCGAFKVPYCHTYVLEALAAYYGINTARSLHGDCDITAYIDIDWKCYKGGGPDNILDVIRKYLQGNTKARIQLLPPDKKLRAFHQHCHDMAGVRQKVKFNKKLVRGQTAARFILQHQDKIPQNTLLWT